MSADIENFANPNARAGGGSGSDFDANAPYSTAVQICVPIVTVIVFILAEAALYIVNDPGLKRAQIGVVMEVDESGIRKTHKRHRQLREENAAVPQPDSSQMNTGNSRNAGLAQGKDMCEISIQCTIIGDSRTDESINPRTLRRVNTDIQIARLPNETEAMLSAYLLKQPALGSTQLNDLDETQLRGRAHSIASSSDPNYHTWQGDTASRQRSKSKAHVQAAIHRAEQESVAEVNEPQKHVTTEGRHTRFTVGPAVTAATAATAAAVADNDQQAHEPALGSQDANADVSAANPSAN